MAQSKPKPNSDLNNFGAQQTADFVLSAVPSNATILDVGCGPGNIAALLTAAGLRVSAIDANESAVNEARANGVAAEHADFLTYTPAQRFDAILFSRSLHHILPVSAALAHARELLTPTGVLVIDDFACEQVDLETATWFFGLKSFFAAHHPHEHGHTHGRGPALDDGKIPPDPLASWRDHHFAHHGVTESTLMLPAIRDYFTVTDERRVPYLYLYFMSDTTEAEAQVLYDWEKQLCHLGTIRTIGLRVIARQLTP